MTAPYKSCIKKVRYNGSPSISDSFAPTNQWEQLVKNMLWSFKCLWLCCKSDADCVTTGNEQLKISSILPEHFIYTGLPNTIPTKWALF